MITKLKAELDTFNLVVVLTKYAGFSLSIQAASYALFFFADHYL